MLTIFFPQGWNMIKTAAWLNARHDARWCISQAVEPFKYEAIAYLGPLRYDIIVAAGYDLPITYFII